MSYQIGIIIPSIIGVVAIIIAIISFLEGRKRTKLLETMIKTLPYTSRRRRPKVTSTVEFDNKFSARKTKEDETKRIRLELEREKLQWKKNKDIAKGIAWIIDHLITEDDED